ncbi:hypothetical protein COLO4_11837 [Corchorus olitorius]|uniref:Transmembrane protein n=1 Tax=Corchorus olitorius TaxID=93759 RepID=A0A1R3K323_9ROSI|nr:hypothetical protein COLO4_11837 [Corchorus olitorius]
MEVKSQSNQSIFGPVLLEINFKSVAFTSAPFAAIAVVWFVLFGLFLFCAFICCCCCRRNKPYGYSRVAYALSVIFLLLFTIAAIAGCVIMYTGEAKFMSSVTSVTKYIVNRGLDIVNKLISVYNYLSSAKTIVFNEHFLPSDLLGQIDNVNSLINATGNLPQLTSVHIHDTILLVLNPVNVIFFAITVFLIVLAFLGFLFSILGLQCCVYIFVVIGWIIITVTFLMCGVFLVFHNIVSDTCVAMDQWVQNPMANATLKEFLPCLDKEFGENVLEASKSVSSGVDTLLNQYIDLVANNNNQTGPLVPLLCEPNTTQGCGAGHVALGNAPEEWKKYVCEASKDGICTTAGRLTPDMYNHMTSAVNVSYGLNDMGPFLAGLVDCSMIIDTFKDISQNHCPGLKKFSQWVYIGFGLKGIHVKIEEENSTLVLAADRTHRKDPLDNFNYYKGGWNITEKHYFSSVGFTAAPLFLIAGFCTGCIVLYFAQGSFHSSTTNTVEYVVEQADITVDKLRNVSESLQVAKLIGVNQISLPPNIQADIESVDKKINDYAKTLESETKGNSGKTRHVLDSIKLALIIIASVMLLLAFLGFAFSVSGMPISVYISVIIGWILVTVIFVLCGMFIIVQNTMTDTCVAMDQWVQYPRAQTSLDDILPCMDHTTAQQALDESNDVTNSLIGIVNDFISNVANSNIPRDGSPIFYNQSGPVVPLLCSSPYNSDKSCNDDQVNFSNAAEVKDLNSSLWNGRNIFAKFQQREFALQKAD